VKLKSELLPGEKPKRGRRVQLKCLDDALREHRFIYGAMINGRLSLEDGDILSRVIGRHKEIIAVRDQARQLDALLEQLKTLHGGAAIAFDPDLIE
jgi:hypothetical protein